MEMSWISGALRTFFFWLDKGIYWLAEGSYNIITELASVQIIEQSTVKVFAERIYVLLGIFMLFKIAFSLIKMFLNPESLNDSKAGGGKLVQRIVVSFLILIMVPFVFDKAYELQGIIINKNVIPTVILGVSTDMEHTKNVNKNAGNIMSVTVFKSFFRSDGDRYKSDGNSQLYQDVYTGDPASGITVSDFAPLVEAGSNDRYYFDYSIGLSTVAGIALAYIMIIFCFEIAVRSIKLSFLQLIAPIPVISYMDQSKGDKIFNTWLKNCVSTYLDLFVRFIAIYFVIFIIAELVGNSQSIFNSSDNPFVVMFVIFGLLLFAKEAPQLIYDILGIKPPKGLELNPFKKLATVPLAGSAAAFAAGGAINKMRGGGFFRGGLNAAKKMPLAGGDGKTSVAAPVSDFMKEKTQNYFGKYDDQEKLRKQRQSMNKGKEIYENVKGNKNSIDIKDPNNADQYSRLQNFVGKDIAEAMKKEEEAKDVRNKMQSRYEKMKMRLESGDTSVTAEQVDKARIDSVKASKDYDTVKASLDSALLANPKYKENYDAYNVAKTDAETEERIRKNQATLNAKNNQPQTTANAQGNGSSASGQNP